MLWYCSMLMCRTEFKILNKLKRKLIQYVILLAINQGSAFVKKNLWATTLNDTVMYFFVFNARSLFLIVGYFPGLKLLPVF